MSLSTDKNIGAYLHASFAYASATQTAGATTDVQGVAIDRLATGMNKPLSCSVLVAITATLASTHTLALALKVQHSVDSTSGDFVDYNVQYTTVTAPVIVTGNVGGTAQNFLVKFDVDLNGAKEWIRIDMQPVFSASTVDTAVLSAVVVFGGMAILP